MDIDDRGVASEIERGLAAVSARSLPAEIPAALLEQLLVAGEWSAEQVLEQVGRAEPWRRAAIVAPLVAYLPPGAADRFGAVSAPPPAPRPAGRAELDAALAAPAEVRLWEMLDVVPRLPPTLRAEGVRAALAAAEQYEPADLEDDADRWPAVYRALGPHLDDAQLAAALRDAGPEVVAALAARLDRARLDRAVDRGNGAVLAEIAEFLDREQLDAALAAAGAIADERERAGAIAGLAPRLDADQARRAAAAAAAIVNRRDRSAALTVGVARQLGPARLAEVLDAIAAVGPVHLRRRPLAAVARRAPAALLPRIADAAAEVADGDTLVVVARRAAAFADVPEARAAALTVLRAALAGDRRGTALAVLAELAGLLGDPSGLRAAVLSTLDRWP